MGAELGLPDRLVWRQPFPGPGLAISIVGGEATKERLDVLREADPILQEEIRAAGRYRELWQSFCVLPDIRTVGVQGDERTYGDAIVAARGDERRRDDRGLGEAPLRPARADRIAHDQRAARGQSRGPRHHLEPPGTIEREYAGSPFHVPVGACIDRPPRHMCGAGQPHAAGSFPMTSEPSSSGRYRL